MNEYLERQRKQQELFRERMTHQFVQPDGRERSVDFSAPGGFGDFAVEVSGEGVTRAEAHFFAYWTDEAPIFSQIVAYWQSVRSTAELYADVEQIERRLEKIESIGMTATSEGEGKIFDWLQRQSLDNPRRRIDASMNSGGDDTLSIDASLPDMLDISIDRAWDEGERITSHVSVLPDDVWKWMMGMMGRSYSAHQDTYPQLTRIPTSEFRTMLACAVERHEQSSHRTLGATANRHNLTDD